MGSKDKDKKKKKKKHAEENAQTGERERVRDGETSDRVDFGQLPSELGDLFAAQVERHLDEMRSEARSAASQPDPLYEHAGATTRNAYLFEMATKRCSVDSIPIHSTQKRRSASVEALKDVCKCLAALGMFSLSIGLVCATSAVASFILKAIFVLVSALLFAAAVFTFVSPFRW